jgi:hypothetical protein
METQMAGPLLRRSGTCAVYQKFGVGLLERISELAERVG